MKAVHMVQIIREIRPAPAFILSAQPIKYFSTWIRQCAPCKRKKTRFKYRNRENWWWYVGLCQILIFPIFQVDGYSDGKPDETLVTRLSLSLQKCITQITISVYDAAVHPTPKINFRFQIQFAPNQSCGCGCRWVLHQLLAFCPKPILKHTPGGSFLHQNVDLCDISLQYVSTVPLATS